MPSVTFGYTGGWQSWNVPTGVDWVDVILEGAAAGPVHGGRVAGRLKVDDSWKLYILVGQAGGTTSSSNGARTATGGGGAGGDGNSVDGGGGGGGGTFLRVNSSTGTLKAVAGGAGGQSGDNGDGGEGGGSTGGSGHRGTSGSNSTGAATGGTQSQGGNGGTSSSGSSFKGGDATNGVGDRGGRGGDPGSNYGHGGGGGGGGYRSGGGGQASSKGYAPGGGGGGGSNYVGGLIQVTNTQGSSAATGNGRCVLTWDSPPPANIPPSPPSKVKVEGKDPVDEQVTRSTGRVTVTAEMNDPDNGDQLQLLVRRSTEPRFALYVDQFSAEVDNGHRATVELTNLSQDTRYFCRLYARDNHGKYSNNYTSIDFWTNRQPLPPTLTGPGENQVIPSLDSVVFSWTHSDPDTIGSDKDSQTGFELQYRRASTPVSAAGPATTIQRTSITVGTWTVNPGVFKGNTFYEWRVRTQDEQNHWGLFSLWRSFYISSTSTPPRLTRKDYAYPINGVAVDVQQPVRFTWEFMDPDPGDTQRRADIRWRVAGQDDTQWINRFGMEDPGVPGHFEAWTLPANTFVPGYRYEWQARTYDQLGAGQSDWSDSAFFQAIATPGRAVVAAPVVSPLVQGSLGCGQYRVFLYDQGGQVQRGEVEPLTSLTFGRMRDDISNCVVVTNGFGDDCCGLYQNLRSWAHELVVFRDGVRVWEGPITRITYQVNSVEIEAKDVMAYLYRRIMRQGFNDAYRNQPGLFDPDTGDPVPYPRTTVVERAGWIITNALAPHDPNVLPFLTAFEFDDDAATSRVVADYTQTAWEQVDDMAATAGLDYTTVGRRIILWDTHRAIGRLPEMRDGDFNNPPIVTEYGMQLCNYMAVTNGSGIAGAVRPEFEGIFEHNRFTPVPNIYYGPVEMLASSYSEAAGGTDEVLTAAAKSKLVEDLQRQAERNISGRWPTPLVVRVPDNSTLSPEVAISFDQLVPGVWIPLRSTGTCREVAQWQKLDSITVTFTPDAGENVQVVMSPAPLGAEDIDLTGGGEESISGPRPPGKQGVAASLAVYATTDVDFSVFTPDLSRRMTTAAATRPVTTAGVENPAQWTDWLTGIAFSITAGFRPAVTGTQTIAASLAVTASPVASAQIVLQIAASTLKVTATITAQVVIPGADLPFSDTLRWSDTQPFRGD